MPKLTEIPFRGILKTIEGDLQNALYYNSNALFSKDDSEIMYHLRKVISTLEDILKKVEELGPINTRPDIK